MKRVLVAVVLMVVLGLQSAGHIVEASDWSRVVQRVAASTAPLTCSLHSRNVCTAFSINAEQGLYLTANHCAQPFMSDEGEAEVPFLDGQALTVVFVSEALDLAIVKSAVKRPALTYRTKPLLVGAEVGSYGYGYGLVVPIFRTSIISAFVKDPTGIEWTFLDSALIGGMSGGPVVDRDGRVVGVNDKSDNWSGFSLSLTQILTATQFWE